MPQPAGSVIVEQDSEAFFNKGVELFVEAVSATANPSVALSGGSTPRKLFERLASPSVRVPWAALNIFWGDERCVPPDHADSNYRMADDALLSRVPIDRRRVHRMKGELDPSQAAAAYQDEMAAILPGRPFPSLDFSLLGMGDDGHTASLFPGSPGLTEAQKWVVGHRVDKLNTNRLTMTFPVLNQARVTLIMVSGASKADMMARVFAGTGVFPIERVRPAGRLIWLLDAAAAQKLPPKARAGEA